MNTYSDDFLKKIHEQGEVTFGETYFPVQINRIYGKRVFTFEPGSGTYTGMYVTFDNPSSRCHYQYQAAVNRIAATIVIALVLVYLYFVTENELKLRGILEVAPTWLFWSYYIILAGSVMGSCLLVEIIPRRLVRFLLYAKKGLSRFYQGQ